MPRIYRWALAVWALVSLAFCLRSLLRNETQEMLVALATFAIWFAIGLWSLALAVHTALQKRFRSAAFACFMPLASWVLQDHGRDLGDAIRFQADKPAYLAGIAKLKQTDARPVAFFPWGSHPSPTPPGSVTLHGVVFDPDGTILRSPEARRAAWRDRKVANVLLCQSFVQPMDQDFYLAWLNCPAKP